MGEAKFRGISNLSRYSIFHVTNKDAHWGGLKNGKLGPWENMFGKNWVFWSANNVVLAENLGCFHF